MNDDPMIPARGCHPSIIQLDNRASEQRGTFSNVQMCKYPVFSIQYQCKFKCRCQLALKLVIGN